MKTKARIYQLIGSREDGVLLNSDLTSFGRRSQVTAALLELCANGWIECIEQDVYVLPVKLTGLNGKTLLTGLISDRGSTWTQPWLEGQAESRRRRAM